MTTFRISRRRLMQAAAIVPILGAPAIVRRANAQSSFDWKRYAGEKIDVALTKTPRNDYFQSVEHEFTELTGIEVSSEQIPEQQARQKQVIEFASGSPTFDVTNISLAVMKRLAGKGQWLEDLRPMLDDPEQTAPDFDFADISRGGVAFSTQADGRMDTLPCSLDYFLLYYNKELFEQAGVEFPTSMDDIVQVAAKLTKPENNVYGFVSRGLKNANVPVWMNLLFGQDIDALDAGGKLMTDTDEAIWAANLYRTLNKDYAPPGTIGFNWSECQTTFTQGYAAMWLDSTAWARAMEDPAKSRIAGKVGYGVMPAGPKASASAIFAEGIGIARGSKKKGPAWLYLQWYLNKKNQSMLVQTGAGSSARISPFKDPAVIENSPLPRAYFDMLVKSIDIGRPGLPDIIPVTEFRDTFGVALTNMIGGAEAAPELKAATEAFRPILEKSEKA
ncbi:MAG: sugar ABC transporter substrate-binding protein [Rhizobiaceae bacterium]|nr:sugar ABC transporter substrate-binding protein [Rhizobiaceae bacterium]